LRLHFDSATHRVDDASKLDEQTVARCLDDATAMFLDFGIRQLAPKRASRASVFSSAPMSRL
jgi:hypothetical protein